MKNILKVSQECSHSSSLKSNFTALSFFPSLPHDEYSTFPIHHDIAIVSNLIHQ